MTPELRARAREMSRATRQAQGLPPHVEDLVAIEKAAVLLGPLAKPAKPRRRTA
jgi:hypothetical protein